MYLGTWTLREHVELLEDLPRSRLESSVQAMRPREAADCREVNTPSLSCEPACEQMRAVQTGGTLQVHPRIQAKTKVDNTIVCYTELYSALLCSTLLFSTLLYSTLLLYSTPLLYSTLLYSTLLYSTLLYLTILCHIVPYYIFYSVLYYIVLHYTIYHIL